MIEQSARDIDFDENSPPRQQASRGAGRLEPKYSEWANADEVSSPGQSPRRRNVNNNNNMNNNNYQSSPKQHLYDGPAPVRGMESPYKNK